MQDAISTLNESSSELQQMQVQIQSLLSQARQNEATLKKFREIELAVIGASDLKEIVTVVIQHMKVLFNVDEVFLALVDADGTKKRLLDIDNNEPMEDRVCFLRELSTRFCEQIGVEPWAGPYHVGRHKRFTRSHNPSLKSIAILPLSLQGVLLGYLSIASCESNRFSRLLATDFIKQLGVTMSVCIDNVVKRDQSKVLDPADPYNRLHDRVSLDRRLIEEIGRAQRSVTSLSCILVNTDRQGPAQACSNIPANGLVLSMLARLLVGQIRCSDIVGKYSDRSFLILLPDSDSQVAMLAADRIRSAIMEDSMRVAANQSAEICISVGVSTLQSDRNRAHLTERAQRMLRAAEQALARAKTQGGNRVACFGLC